MSQDAPRGEGFDLGAMLRQAQQMQETMTARQAELAGRRYEGTAGGGLVKASVSGGRVESVEFDPKSFEDPEMVGDLVTAAINNALEAADEDSQAEMGKITGDLDLGGLLGS
jgi:nucleoid-associated protein EbfC